MILAINTSTPQFSLAILQMDGTLAAEYLMSREKGHFGAFMPTLDFILSNMKIQITDIKAIAVASGPGSFTGMRVGLAAAKGLCHGLQIPVIGIPTLDALAMQLPYADLPLTPVLYSRKNELYAAQFVMNSDHHLRKTMDYTSLKTHALASVFTEPCIFIGNDFYRQSSLIKDVMGETVRLAPSILWQIRAGTIGAMAFQRFHANDFDDPYLMDPIYLRPPDIHIKPAGPAGAGNK